MAYWLIKSEPESFSLDDFRTEKVTVWYGVRNYAARNNLKAMQLGDLVFFYHSNEGLEVVGLAKVVRESYQDPTTDDNRWVVVDLEPVEKLPKSVTLKQIKSDERLKDIGLIKQMRLSVTAIKKEEFDIVLGLAYE